MDAPAQLTDRYHLTSHLARGGMADVFEGQDTLLNRKVAIKVLHSQYSSDEAFVKRFRREAQAAANLSHPNIVGIYDWGQAEGTYFIVMEIVEGRSLRDVLKTEGPLLPRRATEIAAEVTAALSVAHQAGLVHRDVKPGNILLAPDGTVKVTDFGIARAWDDSQELTRTGAVIGTATYFSPEQAQGEPADARSDVYSLGVVLYEMLTGRPPFTGDSPVSVAFQHVSTEAPDPSSLSSDVPQSLDAIAIKSLRKDPAARYQSADEMRADLLTALRGEEVAVPVVAAAGAAATAQPEDATRVMSTVPPPTVPPDEVYREIEGDPPSQLPFILTAFGLLIALVILLFVLFQVAGDDSSSGEQIPVPNVNGLTQQDANDRLRADGFEVAFQFEPSETVETGNVIRSDPEGGTLADEGSTVTLFISSGTEAVEVPPVIGETLDRARTLVQEANLTVGNIEEMPSADFDEGIVMDQSPDSGIEVGAGTAVDLVVSTGPEIVEIPDLENFTEVDAISALVGLGLNFDTEQEFSNTIAEGFVIRTEPEAGTEAQSGDVILIVVSRGPQPVEVPSLILLTPAEAEAILSDLGLVMQISTTTQPVVDPAQHGLIVDQNPGVGTTLLPGDIVRVTLGEFTPPPTTTTLPPPQTTTTPP